jgi:exoribonuclease II
MFRLSQQFVPGEVVLYEHQGASLLAMVLEKKLDKVSIFNERGREAQLQSNRLFKLPQTTPAQVFSSKEQRLEVLHKVRKKAEELISTINLADLWEFVEEESREYSCTELTTLYFGEDTLEQHVGLRFHLGEEKIYFKRTKNGFVPRSAESIQEIKHSEEVKKQKEERQLEISSFFAARMNGEDCTCPEDLSDVMELLFDVAAGCDDLTPEQKKDTKILLQTIRDTIKAGFLKPPGGSSEEADLAFHFLLTARLTQKDENLFFRRHRMPGPLSQETHNFLDMLQEKLEAIALQSRPYSEKLFKQIPNSLFFVSPNRLDLLHLECLTIDDVSTTDADDAISLTSTSNGYLLGIHITDVAALIPKEGIINEELAERATSVYLPDQTMHMVSYEPGRSALSLFPGGKRLAVSFLINLNRDFEPTCYKLTPSVISISRKCSYDEVDQELYDSDSLFNLLYQAASTFEAARLARGAVKFEKREAIIKPTKDGGLKVEEIDEETPARMIIRELMVLYNAAAAELAKIQSIPIPFRCQDAPDQATESDFSHIPPGPALDLAMRMRLKRSYIRPTPSAHSSLGLDAYTQATSPMRRYLDLVTQRQLHALCTGDEVSYNQSGVQNEIEMTIPALARAFSVSKDTKRYWQLRYLEEKVRHGVPIEATIIRLEKRYQLVLLEEIFMTAQTKTLGDYNLGNTVSLTVTAASARGDVLRLAKSDKTEVPPSENGH